MDKKIKNIIEETTKEILKIIGFKVKVEIEEIKDEEYVNMVCNIIAKEESNFIIGQDGRNLQAIQHIIRLAVRKKTDELIRFTIDVNFYKKERNKSVVDLAINIAKQVSENNQSISLRPMSAYERRLVHMTLANDEKIITESAGERDDRRIIIRSRLNKDQDIII